MYLIIIQNYLVQMGELAQSSVVNLAVVTLKKQGLEDISHHHHHRQFLAIFHCSHHCSHFFLKILYKEYCLHWMSGRQVKNLRGRRFHCWWGTILSLVWCDICVWWKREELVPLRILRIIIGGNLESSVEWRRSRVSASHVSILFNAIIIAIVLQLYHDCLQYAFHYYQYHQHHHQDHNRVYSSHVSNLFNHHCHHPSIIPWLSSLSFPSLSILSA